MGEGNECYIFRENGTTYYDLDFQGDAKNLEGIERKLV